MFCRTPPHRYRELFAIAASRGCRVEKQHRLRRGRRAAERRGDGGRRSCGCSCSTPQPGGARLHAQGLGSVAPRAPWHTFVDTAAGRTAEGTAPTSKVPPFENTFARAGRRAVPPDRPRLALRRPARQRSNGRTRLLPSAHSQPGVSATTSGSETCARAHPRISTRTCGLVAPGSAEHRTAAGSPTWQTSFWSLVYSRPSVQRTSS